MSKHNLWSEEEQLKFQDKFGVSIWQVSTGRWIYTEKVTAKLERELTSKEIQFIVHMACQPRFTNLNENLKGTKKARQSFQVAHFPGGIVELVEKGGYVNYPFGIAKGCYDITHLPTGCLIGMGGKFYSYGEVKLFVDMVVETVPNLEEIHYNEDVQKQYKSLYANWS